MGYAFTCRIILVLTRFSRRVNAKPIFVQAIDIKCSLTGILSQLSNKSKEMETKKNDVKSKPSKAKKVKSPKKEKKMKMDSKSKYGIKELEAKSTQDLYDDEDEYPQTQSLLPDDELFSDSDEVYEDADLVPVKPRKRKIDEQKVGRDKEDAPPVKTRKRKADDQKVEDEFSRKFDEGDGKNVDARKKKRTKSNVPEFDTVDPEVLDFTSGNDQHYKDFKITIAPNMTVSSGTCKVQGGAGSSREGFE